MSNVADRVLEHGSQARDRVAIRSAGREYTYGWLRAEVGAYAERVRQAGIAPGDRVLLLAPSVPEFAVAYYGLHAAGAVVVPVNTMATAPEISYVISDAGCRLVVAWNDAAAATTAAETAGIQHWTLEPGPQAGEVEPAVHDSADSDTAVILYTSGTTGKPKGARLTHGNLIACADAFLDVLEVTEDDRMGTALPLFHVFGQAVCMNTVLRAGAGLSILSPFDPVALLRMMRDDGLSVMSGVPTMWNAMLHVPGDEFSPADFGHLRLAASGGASLPADVMRAFGERFGCAILEGYGLTETTGAATFNGLQRERKVGAVGIALPGSEVQIRDTEGIQLPTGEIGEVTIKGPVVMSGYWNKPTATAEVLDDEGWFRSGDLGTMDADGDVRIVDRTKDLIIRGGYNVYPREVEEVLWEHPDVVEVAVVGVPDSHFGEEVAAVLTMRPGAQLDAEKMREWAKEQLSAYKVPRIYHVVDALPKGPTGKILKRGLDRQAILDALPPRP